MVERQRFFLGHPYDAVLALTMGGPDEAALVLRGTRGMRAASRKRMQLPRWRFQGSIIANTTAQDELCTELCRLVLPGRKCLLCVGVDSRCKYENSGWVSVGRAYGAVETLLAGSNCYDPETDRWQLTPKSWNQEIATHQELRVIGGAEQSLVQSCCLDRYPLERVSEAMARAILMADHVIMTRGVWQ